MTLKINSLALLFCISCIFVSCKKTSDSTSETTKNATNLAENRLDNEFLIHGNTFDNSLEHVYLFKFKQDSLIPIDTIKVSEKSFTIKGMSDAPEFYAIKTDDSNELFKFLVDTSEINMFLNSNLYLSSTSSESDLQKTYQDYLATMNRFDYRERELFLKYKTQPSITKRASLLNTDLESLHNEKIAFVHDFIIQNNTSAFTPLVFNDNYTSFSSDRLRKMHDTLSSTIKEMSLVKAINTKITNQEEAELQTTTKSNEYRPKAYTLSGPNTDGQTMSLASLKGKVVLVDFWASWCAPCRATNPNLVHLYNKYKSKGFVVLSVSEDKGEPEWLSAIQVDNLTWNTHILDKNKRIAFRYGVESIPHKILVDRQGRIASEKISGPSLEQRLIELLND